MAEGSSPRLNRRQQAASQSTSELQPITTPSTTPSTTPIQGDSLRQLPSRSRRKRTQPPGLEKGAGDGTSLRLRLLQTVLPAVLLPLLFMGLSGYWLTHKRAEEGAERQLQNQALLISESTTALLEDLQTIPQIIASSPLVINEARAGSETVSAENLDEVAIADLEKQYAANRLLRTHFRLNTYLQETAQSSDIAEILVTERHGYNVAYSKLTTDFVQSDEDWWQNGKENGQWVSPPDFDFASKNITVELVKSIQDPSNGDFLGVVKTILPARKFRLLAQYLQRTGISGSQRVQLIDGSELKTIDTFSTQGSRKSRNIIGDQAVEGVIEAFSATDLTSTDDGALLTALRQDSPVKNLSIAFKDDTTTVASFSHAGRQFKLANVPGTQWVAIASMDHSEIEALGRSQLALLGLTTLVLGGITTAFLLWLSRQLTAPLDALAGQAHQVAGGDFNTLVTPVGTAETRTLTESFNQLVVKTKGLLERQETETQKAQVFAAITSATANTLGELAPMLAETLPEAQRLLKADRMLFYPVEPGQSQQLAAESKRPELPSVLPPSAGCVPLKVLTAKPGASAVAINNIRQLTQDDAHQAHLRSLNIESTLTMPVFNDGEHFGTLIAQRSAPGPWQTADADFITQLATQLRLVLDRISSFQRVKESRRIEQESRQVVQASQQMAQESRQMAEVLTVEKQQQQERLQQQISALVNDIQGVSQGDLTVRARVPEGELKTVADVFNQTVGRLQELVNQVKASTVQVNTFLGQNEAAAAQLSQTTHTQKQEAERTLDSVNAMIDGTSLMAQRAQQVAASSQSVAAQVALSASNIDLTAARINQLNDTSINAVKQIEGLGRSSENIGQVTEMIRELANDISALANQASTAMPQPEVSSSNGAPYLDALTQKINRKANRTLEETNLIDSFLNTLAQRSQQIASAIEQINHQVSVSTQQVQSSKQSFEEVTRVAQQFDQLAQSIASSTQEQTQTSQAISTLVQEVVSLSDLTDNFSQNMESALHQTLTTAQDLQNSISRFKVDK